MDTRYYEDWNVGDRVETGTVEVTRDSAIAFATAYDPQPFHLDDEAAKASIFGELSISGWQTASLSMRALVTSGYFPESGLIGLGVDKLRWSKPVYPGDTLRVRTSVTSKRGTNVEKPGVVTFYNETFNQHDEIVMEHGSIAMIPHRPSA